MPFGRTYQTLVASLFIVIGLGAGATAQPDAYSPKPEPQASDAGADAPDASTPDASSPAAGSGSNASSSSPAASSVDTEDPESLAKAAYRAVTTKDWFLLAGAILAFVTLGIRWLLKTKWPTFAKDRWGVALVAGLAGVGGLANAWLADEAVASSQTFMGALRVFAAAVWAYVVSKKIFAPSDDAAA